MKYISSSIILITILFNSAFTSIKAQDSTDTEEGWKWHWEEVPEWVDWWNKKPTITLLYGFSNITREGATTPFADNNLLEFRLGYTTKKTSRHANYIVRHKFRYLFLTNNSTNLAGGSNTTNDLETNNWRFGFGSASGYGYKVGESAAVIPYYSSSLDWTRMNFTSTPSTENDVRIAGLYDDTFRFGTSSEGGIKLQSTRLLTFEVGYERSAVFERHLFWKWAGSGLIELISQGALDIFLDKIIESSPDAGPIVYFILKSALGYGIYELRKEKMNWPFTSTPPIIMDNVKFGVTFVF